MEKREEVEGKDGRGGKRINGVLVHCTGKRGYYVSKTEHVSAEWD